MSIKAVIPPDSKFGLWYVVADAPSRGRGSSSKRFLLCRCACGTEREVACGALVKGKTYSCGCYQRSIAAPQIKMVGKRFGKLMVVAEAAMRGRRKRYLSCRCDCGVTKDVCYSSLAYGKQLSCGCVGANNARERMHHISRKHGLHESRVYVSWEAMIQRCTNPNAHNYRLYGGRGIKICTRWLNNFKDFYADMGDRPAGTSIDRWPNNDGNYEPGNCRWATASEQARNRRPRGARVSGLNHDLPFEPSANRTV